MEDLEFGWFVPTNGDTTNLAVPAEVPQSLELFDRVAKAAETARFDYVLLPVQTVCWEAMVSAAMLAGRTKRLRYLVAMRPGYVNSALLARMITTFDQLSQGRISINLIAGASDIELSTDGIDMTKQERYWRMDDEVSTLRALWGAREFREVAKRYVDVDAIRVLPPPYQKHGPKFYLGGGSEQAWQISAKHADVHLFWGDTLDFVRTSMAELRTMAARHGRGGAISFGMRLQIICRESEEEAWAFAHRLVAGVKPERQRFIREHFAASAANRRVQHLADEHGELIGPSLWTGITRARPGAGIAIVGNPEQCADAIQRYIDIGCRSFCLSGYLHDEEAERFGRLVRPILARRNPGRLAH